MTILETSAQTSDTTEYEVVHPVLYAAVERVRNLETYRNEVARLTAIIANSALPVVLTPSTASVSVGPIPYAPKPTPAALGISGYDGIDKDVQRTIINDIRKIENYDSTIQGDTARK
ncbi:hypothetical protein N7445_006273 [Penicillium cf. griseofulvum]|nr:hypothetical protein N7445_006273 [Penicillium cf. griseofulvum]